MTSSNPPSKATARVFTVTERRTVLGEVQAVFDRWLDPKMRKAILGKGLHKNGVKRVEPYEGGAEVTQTRWRNQLIGSHHRRYLAIHSPRSILSTLEIHFSAVPGIDRQHVMTNELILFEPAPAGKTEIVAAIQCMSLEPSLIQSMRDSWRDAFDTFENPSTLIEEPTT